MPPYTTLEHIWQALAKRHLCPKRDSVPDLVWQLRVRPDKLKERALQAIDERDTGFLRNLSDATKAKIAYLALSVTGMTLLTFRDLCRRLGHRPRRDQLRERVEQRWGKKISERQWRRTFGKDGIESLFSSG